MINKWSHKGHELGQCIASPNNKMALVQIPKNASSYWKTWLGMQGWKPKLYNQLSNETVYFTVLRDPVDRWLSGIAEYFVTYHSNHKPNKFIADLVQDIIVVDDHTETQSYFLQPFQSVEFFDIKKLNQVWNFLNIQPKEHWYLNPINYTNDPVNSDRKKWKDFFKENIDLNRIEQFYKTYDQKIYKELNNFAK